MRLTSVLVGVLLVAILATPALAGPGRGKTDKPQTRDPEKQIQQLTRELKKLEKRLEKAQSGRAAAEKAVPEGEEGRRTIGEQHRRMAEARRRLAGLLAERGRGGAVRAPEAPKAPKPPASPRAHRRHAAAEPAQGPAWMGALHRLHEENRKLAARVQVLERQIRRVGAGIGKLEGAEHGRQGRQGRPEHAAPPHHAPGKPASIEARLARLERAVRALVARERRGGHAQRSPRQGRRMHGRSMRGGPRWMERARAHGQRRDMRRGPGAHAAMRHPGGGDRGPGMGHDRGPGHRGPRAAHRGAGRLPWGSRASGHRGGRMERGPAKPGRAHGDGPCPHCGS